MNLMLAYLRFAIVALFLMVYGLAPAVSPTQQRLDEDIARGEPIVIQLSVALADNAHQWIVPVPAAIGNGRDARSNLYWGARYGVKTYLTRSAGWTRLASVKPSDSRILERLVLKRVFTRKGRKTAVYLVADAWDGKYIRDTIRQFIRYNAGHDHFELQLDGKRLSAGGNARLIAYIGHNALMDSVGVAKHTLTNPTVARNNPQNDAIVLACESKPYFLSRLKAVNAHPLLLTTGLMAPEAYSLHAAIEQWIAGGDDKQVRKAAAASYNRYQKTGLSAAERLFGVH